MIVRSGYIIYDANHDMYLRAGCVRTFCKQTECTLELFDTLDQAVPQFEYLSSNKIIFVGFRITSDFLYTANMKLEIRSCRIKSDGRICIGSKNCL